MTTADHLINELDPNRAKAIEALAKMFREGINDTLHLPEVHSEAEEATHVLLGCVEHMAMLLLAGTVISDPDEPTPPQVVQVLERVLTEQLTLRAARIVIRREPLGPNVCGRTRLT